LLSFQFWRKSLEFAHLVLNRKTDSLDRKVSNEIDQKKRNLFNFDEDDDDDDDQDDDYVGDEN